MSSPVSPALADYREALPAAVAEVAENSLFSFADACDEATFCAAASTSLAEDGGEWLRAGVDFIGTLTGHFDITLPETLARRLCASFAGADGGDDIPESGLLDFAGELANMVCGTWLTRSCREQAFTLTPPRVLRQRPHAAEPCDTGCERMYLSLDDEPIRLQLQWTADPCPGQSRGSRARARQPKEPEWPTS
jgi:hypothetical protein